MVLALPGWRSKSVDTTQSHSCNGTRVADTSSMFLSFSLSFPPRDPGEGLVFPFFFSEDDTCKKEGETEGGGAENDST